jgi:streptogramin lyase
VVARIAVDDSPRQPVLAADGLWVVGERALYRIDPSSNRLVATVPGGTLVAAPAAVALAAGVAWVPSGASSSLWRVDRAANRVDGRIGLGRRRLLGPVGVAAWDDTVWVSCCAFQHGPRPAGMLLRVDTRRNRVVGRVFLAAGSRVEAITATPGGIWAVDTGDHNVLRLDPGSGRVGLAVAAPVPRGVGVGDAGAWVIVTNDRTLARVDEQGGRLRARVPAEVVRDVRGIAVGPGALWVTTGNEVVRLDPRRLP